MEQTPAMPENAASVDTSPPVLAENTVKPTNEEPPVTTEVTNNTLPSPGVAKNVISKRARDWLGPDGEPLGYHLTIGPHGVDWVRRLGLEGARKTSEPEMGGSSGDELPTRRSTDCIVTPKDLAASSDSDLLRSAPPWATTHPRPKFRFSPEKAEKETSLSDSSRTVSSQEGEEATTKSEESAAAKKTRVKQSLMKRARSVAIFSLKLKERRAAREASAKEAEIKAKEKWMPPAGVGGELSCIPIEKLISVDDVALDLQRRKNHNSGNS